MIHQPFYLEQYDWTVSVWYAKSKYNLAGVATDLNWLECPDRLFNEAISLMQRGEFNCGFTYSNYDKRESVVVVGLANSPEQYANSVAHECGHLAVQIAEADNIDFHSEQFCYLIGKIAEKMHPISHKLSCCHCSKN